MGDLKAPARSRERIILTGMEGVGKTRAAMQIMLACIGHKYIIETDNTYDEMFESPDFQALQVKEEFVGGKLDTSYYNNPDGTVTLYRVRNWEEYIWAMDQAFTRAERDDWIVIDNISNMWREVQTWYNINAYGKSPAEMAMEIRKRQIKDGKKNHTVMQEQFTDWGAINPQYFENVRHRIQTPPCHLLLIAEQKELTKDSDKESKAIFGPYGVKPDGQKSLGHDGRTLLLLTKDSRFGNETYMLTTMKDRERVKLDGEEWTDFAADFLVGVGGWVVDSGGDDSVPAAKPTAAVSVSKAVAKSVSKSVAKKV